MRIPIHLRCWANRFVCNNSSGHVAKLIELYSDKDDRSLQVGALKCAVDMLKAAPQSGAGGFGHDRINDTLPLVNESGFFVRDNGCWLDCVKPDVDSVTNYLSEPTSQSLILDHVDNLNYAGEIIQLLPARPTLSVTLGNLNESKQDQTIWRAETNSGAITHPFESEPSYLNYFDWVGRSEGVIREDFVLNRKDISELVKAFFDDVPVPDRFKSSVPPFCGYHPDLAAEHAAAFGFV
jgi:hypothetical protein